MTEQKKRADLKDPMVILLSALLVFICGGMTVSGCSKKQDTIKVELDAAFGGDATGYAGIVNECDVTEAITDRLYSLLSQDDRFTVYRTHEAGQSASVSSKAEKIAEDDPALVVSIHTGGVPDASVSGMTVYPDIPSHAKNRESVKAAEAIMDAFTSDTWTPAVRYLYYKPFSDDAYQIVTAELTDTEDYKLETWAILEKTEVPAVVVEQFYVSNAKDTERWANEESYDEIAMTYYKALCSLYELEPKDVRLEKPEEEKKS